MVGVVTARAHQTCDEEDTDVRRWLPRRAGASCWGGGGGGATTTKQSPLLTPYVYILTLGWAVSQPKRVARFIQAPGGMLFVL